MGYGRRRPELSAAPPHVTQDATSTEHRPFNFNLKLKSDSDLSDLPVPMADLWDGVLADQWAALMVDWWVDQKEPLSVA